jgi:hypothetical protein
VVKAIRFFCELLYDCCINDEEPMSPKVVKVEPLETHQLRLFFDNGEVRHFDVYPYLDRGIFKELIDNRYFNQVKPFFGGVHWPHEQDFGPDTLFLESNLESTWEAA